MENITIGLEIESSINAKIHNIECGEYHDGLDFGLSGWTSERDSSIKSSFFSWSECIEFVSRKIKSKDGFFKVINDFKNFISKNGQYELKEVINFNESTGSHIHFSIGSFKFEQKAIYSVFSKTRKFFFNKILNSKIESKKDILRHYNRHYAIQIEKKHFNCRGDDRYTEFNFESENEGLGLEWRSPNMLNIKSWSEFMEFWNIIYDCLEFLYKCAMKFKTSTMVKIDSRFIFPFSDEGYPIELKDENLNINESVYDNSFLDESLEVQNVQY